MVHRRLTFLRGELHNVYGGGYQMIGIHEILEAARFPMRALSGAPTHSPDSAARLSWSRYSLLLGSLSLLLFTCSTAVADDSADAPALRRWAIVAPTNVQETGLADLLTARLSEREQIELVERDRLEAILKEQELASLLEASDSQSRIRLGQILGADALLLPRLVTQDEKTHLRLVISDCQQGARLRQDAMPFEADKLDAIATRCATAVDATIAHVGGGLKYVIGVTPFLSKDDDYQHAHLQQAYSQLLQQALLSVPRVAVIEIEEARAIANELAIAKGAATERNSENDGAAIESRLVPLIVSGEFRVEKSDGEVSAVNLRIIIQDSAGDERNIQLPPMPLDQLPRHLLTNVPEKILSRADTQQDAPLDPGKQLAILTKRANDFSRLGMRDLAAPLREAALLLDPNATEHYLQLFHEGEPFLHEIWESPQSDIVYKENQRRRLNHKRLRYSHQRRISEELIRRRLVNISEAVHLLRKMRESAYRIGYEAKEERQQYVGDAKQFLSKHFASIPKLDTSIASGKNRLVPNSVPASADMQYASWVATGLVHLRAGRGYHELLSDPGERKLLLDLLTKHVPTSTPPLSKTLSWMIFNSVQYSGKAQPLKPQEYEKVGNLPPETRRAIRDFFAELEATNSPANLLYARWGRLFFDESDPDVGLRDTSIEDIDALEALVKQQLQREKQHVEQFQQAFGQQTSLPTRYWERHYRYPSKILNGLRSRHQLFHNPPPPKTAQPEHHVARRKKIQGTPKGTLTRFDFRVAKHPPHVAGIAYLRRFGNDFDLAMVTRTGEKEASLCRMDAVGTLTPLELPKGCSISTYRLNQVCWDGKYLWFPQLWNPDRPEGFTTFVISGDGTDRHAMRSEKELPSSIERIHALGPGRVIATGVIKPERDKLKNGYVPRRWFSEIKIEKDAAGKSRWQIRQFHFANKTFARGTGKRVDEVKLGFDKIIWMHDFPDPHNPDRKIVVVSRYDRALLENNRILMRPLQIDPETLQVGIYTDPIPMSLAGAYPMQDGVFLLPIPARYSWGGLRPGYYLFSPSDPKPDEWFDRFGNSWEETDRRTGSETRKRRPKEIEHEGHIYGCQVFGGGDQWYRVDRETATIDWLTSNKVREEDHPLRKDRFASSVYYGLVSWGSGKMWQINILPVEQARPVKSP